MRRWLLIVGLLGCLDAQAQSPVWALKGAHNTVYIAGSVHFLKKDEPSLPAAIDRADGASLRETIGEARFGHVAKEAARLGVPIDGLNMFEPWAVALTLTQFEY